MPGNPLGIRPAGRYPLAMPAAPKVAPSLSGVVLAGGRSTRMGSDKARLVVAGTPLWRRQMRVLEAIGAQPVSLGLRARQRGPSGKLKVIRDTAAHAGPLGGLHAALESSSTRWLAVLAVDMPHVDPAWFARLLKKCRPGNGAVVAEAAGFQPLAAIYPREAAAIARRRLRDGDLPLQGLVKELLRRRLMVAVRLPARERWRSANWNTPGDMKARPRPAPTGAAGRR
jgi:molybdopterin-guanine dinucleotide biosynthesis protein A